MFQISASASRRMRTSGTLRRAAACVTMIASIGTAVPGAAPRHAQDPTTAAKQQPYVEADVQFMAGMIPHHAQAVLIAGWAPSHGARPDLKILCERIIVAQRDEIALMKQWLKARNHKTEGTHADHASMPGMLTDEQLAELDKARGEAFDRLFLNAMIRHHQGAITMVEQLFASYGAAQDDVIFRFASDVVADQSTEIERMQKMLATVGGQEPQ